MYTFIRFFDPSLPSIGELQPMAIIMIFALDILWTIICHKAFRKEKT